MNHWAIKQAARAIQQGGVIAYPTEAVYGLGCNPFDAQAVMRLLQIKQRDLAQGLILVGDTLESFSPFIQPLQPEIEERMTSSWSASDAPPVTWVVPASADCPIWLRGRFTTLAIRVTQHAQTRALCAEIGMPLVSTSANRSGQAPAKSAIRVRRTLGDALDYILGGETSGYDKPSEIRNAYTGEMIRH